MSRSGILVSSTVGFISARGLAHVELVLPMAGAVAFIVGYLRFPLRWQVTYKGHVVLFQIHPIWGERLYIDGGLVDRGRPGVRITLRGTIESGEGAGERITARSRAGLFSVSCRIVAELFSGTGR